ncbi:SDR family oxidoreductase [Longispora fulva]|nr:SDR family oxidoreductase [Longispora fulva]
MDLRGRTALVTGGTRGLGLAIARKLCASGCDVYVNYARSEADAARAVAELAGLPGVATLLRGDARRPEALLAGLDRLDVYVHNISSFHPAPDGLPTLPDLRADLAMAVEPLLGAVLPLRDLMAGGLGRVIAVSSVGARRVVPAYANLGVAKAALESLVRYLAVELAGQGIAVNAVSTSKLDKGGDGAAERMLASRTPAGRLSTPADVADVVALLCADEAAWIHGQVITADGGLGLRA